jgi:hypothetical protein
MSRKCCVVGEEEENSFADGMSEDKLEQKSVQ